jgi:hypothetical protein
MLSIYQPTGTVVWLTAGGFIPQDLGFNSHPVDWAQYVLVTAILATHPASSTSWSISYSQLQYRQTETWFHISRLIEYAYSHPIQACMGQGSVMGLQSLPVVLHALKQSIEVFDVVNLSAQCLVSYKTFKN